MDEEDVVQWFKNAVALLFVTVPLSLLASLIAAWTGWYEWPFDSFIIVGIITVTGVVALHLLVAIWIWATS